MDRHYHSPYSRTYHPINTYSTAGPDVSSILLNRNTTPNKKYSYYPSFNPTLSNDKSLSKLSTTSNIIPQLQSIQSNRTPHMNYTAFPRYDSNSNYYPKFNIKNKLDPQYASQILNSKQVLMLDSLNKFLQNSLPFNPSNSQIQDTLQEYQQFIQQLQDNLLEEQPQQDPQQNKFHLDIKTQVNNTNKFQSQPTQENLSNNSRKDPLFQEIQQPFFLDGQDPKEVKETFFNDQTINSHKKFSKEKKNKKSSSSSNQSPINKYEHTNFESFKPVSKQINEEQDQKKQNSQRKNKYDSVQKPNDYYQYSKKNSNSDLSDYDQFGNLPQSIEKEKKRVTHDFEPEAFKHVRQDSYKKHSLQSSDPKQFQGLQNENSKKKFSLQCSPYKQINFDEQDRYSKDKKQYKKQETIYEDNKETNNNVQYDFNFSTLKTEQKRGKQDSPQSMIQHDESENVTGTQDLLDQFKMKAMNLNAEIQNMIEDEPTKTYEFSYQLYQQ